MTMELSRSQGRAIQDPTPADIEAALSELGTDGGFLILAKSDEEYVQAAGTCLEYREFEQHYRAVGACGPDLVRSVFLEYLTPGGQWRTMTEWEDVTEEVSTVGGTRYVWYLAGIVGLALIYVAYRALH